MENYILELNQIINARKKMMSPLYQKIMSGEASQKLLKNFVIHRYPIKNLWTRNILGIASRIDNYKLRCDLVTNIYEEETGALTHSRRHLQTFLNFGKSVGVMGEDIMSADLLPETKAVMDHNLEVCNSRIHFTAGVASVLLLMEGQPPIVSNDQKSMESVMRDIYLLPKDGYEFFTHHASGINDGVSELEDEHADTAREILMNYCVTDQLRSQARKYLEMAIELRHKHFDAIYNNFSNSNDPPFRYKN